MTLTDAEKAFYEMVLADAEAGWTIADLRYAYYLAALDGGLPTPDPDPVKVPGGVDATGTPSATTYLRGDGAWAVPTNTTYTPLTAGEAATGTAVAARLISAKVLADEITRRLTAAISGYNADAAQTLQHDATGALIWVDNA